MVEPIEGEMWLNFERDEWFFAREREDLHGKIFSIECILMDIFWMVECLAR